MNPGVMAAGFVHTVPEKLYEYFAKRPFHARLWDGSFR